VSKPSFKDVRDFAKDNRIDIPTEQQYNEGFDIELGDLASLEDTVTLLNAASTNVDGANADGADVAGSNVVAFLSNRPCIGCGLCGCICLVIIISGGVIYGLAYGYVRSICFVLDTLKIKTTNC
jgi:hypothetical protein